MSSFRKHRNKKGSIFDVYFIIGAVFLLAIVAIITQKILTDMNTEFTTNNMIDAAQVTHITNLEARYSSIWDGLILFLFVGLCLAVLISSFMIRTYPFFFFIAIFVLAIFIIVSGVIANVYNEFRANDDLSAAADRFVITNEIFGKFPLYILFASIIIAIVVYSKGGE